MASITRTDRRKKPGRAVQFYDLEKNRRTIRLGRCGLEVVKQFKTRIDALCHAKLTNMTPASEVSEWLAGLPDQTHAKLAAFGLVESRTAKSPALTLSSWLSRYLDQRSDLKPASRKRIAQTTGLLKQHFGENVEIDSITLDGAAEWRSELAVSGIAEGTIRLHCRQAKAIFNAAVERELIEKNPFRKLVSSSVAAARDRYITPNEADRILDACPNVAWRALFGLARFAGLRTPSETHSLTWADVDWDQKRINVHSIKTERYAGHERRLVPITPKLMKVLQDAFDAAPEGQEHVVALSRLNIRRTMRSIAERAGMEPWSHIFQTLRRSCDTEWKQTYPDYAVDRWLGHSREVSEKHYLMIPEEVWERAAGSPGEEGPQGAAGGAAEGPRTELHSTEETPSENNQNAEKEGVLGVSGHWAEAELNRRHTDFQSVALPTELPARFGATFAASTDGGR